MPLDPAVTPTAHHLDYGLQDVRSIRAANRAQILARGIKPIHLVPDLSVADRSAIVRNILDRMEIYAAILAAETADRPMPAGWAEDYADRLLTMVLALAKVTR